MDLPVRLPTSLRAGMLCRCPRCSQGPLFSGFLEVAPSCEICGLDYGFADPADGPAFFVMTGIGILVMGGWAWWTVAVHPPAWQQYLAILVGLLGGCLATLRPVKAWLIAEQFVHRRGADGAEHLAAVGITEGEITHVLSSSSNCRPRA